MKRLAFNAGQNDVFGMLCAGGATPTAFNLKMFEDFEIHHQLQAPVKGAHCVIAADPHHDEDFLALYDLASLLFDEQALKLSIVMPKRKLSQADKNVLSRALTSIPTAPAGNEVTFVDLDRPSTPYSSAKWVHAGNGGKRSQQYQPALDLFVNTQKPVVFCSAKYQYLADEMLGLAGAEFERGELEREFVGNRFIDTAPAADSDTWSARQPRSDAEQALLASRFSKRKVSPEAMQKLIGGDYRNPTEVAHPLAARHRFKRLTSDVRGRHVVIVAGTINEAETMEVYRMANAAYDAGALKITMVVPYFGYSTQERKVKPLESVKAKHRCRLLSFVPRCPLGNEIILVDLHSEAMPGCFENGLGVVHLYAGKQVVKTLSNQGGDWVLLSADVGRSKWVESMARDCNNRLWACAHKSRTDAGSHTTGFSGEVAGRSGKMFDDIGRTLGSAGDAGQLYIAGGCTPLDLVLTHLVAPGDAVDRLRARNVFQNIYVTNTHPRAVQLAKKHPGYVHIHSVAPLLVDEILGRGSLSSTTLS